MNFWKFVLAFSLISWSLTLSAFAQKNDPRLEELVEKIVSNQRECQFNVDEEFVELIPTYNCPDVQVPCEPPNSICTINYLEETYSCFTLSEDCQLAVEAVSYTTTTDATTSTKTTTTLTTEATTTVSTGSSTSSTMPTGEDLHPRCCYWAIKGYCTTRPRFMKETCRKTCGYHDCRAGDLFLDCKLFVLVTNCRYIPGVSVVGNLVNRPLVHRRPPPLHYRYNGDDLRPRRAYATTTAAPRRADGQYVRRRTSAGAGRRRSRISFTLRLLSSKRKRPSADDQVQKTDKNKTPTAHHVLRFVPLQWRRRLRTR